MENITLQMAYSRFGAGVVSRLNNLSSVATDGSLVLTCFGGQFSKPRAGVLRYNATLSQHAGGAGNVTALREHIVSAHAAGTKVRPVMVTPGTASTVRRVFTRPDLTGTVAEFDGDTFAVDFVREEVVETPPPRRKR